MFLYTHGMSYENGKDAWVWKPTKKDIYENGICYGYSVSCNEEEVIEFLLMHGIAFRAVTHYGHWQVIYNGGKVFWRIRNLGEMIGMYGDSNPDAEMKELKKYWNKPFRRINVERYLHPKPMTERQKGIQARRLARLQKKFKRDGM
jgi:beta-lactamase superfamily II metal-dependent hydrolase